ncbi:hypothetical protein VHEMI10596 [[Torrubiella] hemipterigena]|uniref:DUF7136 domain-containing protein n=1 Tax=[Torrubiella] hemipterigena TaxID=1531966 RepID=A0A0A1TJ35_9HYPO|nr:hypothetical protein VHEMI10596 [[Torrubiella] hemipterigena]
MFGASIRTAVLIVCCFVLRIAGAIDTTEVDLIFPRNETYSPRGMMPCILAIQRPDILSHLQPQIRYAVFLEGVRGVLSENFDLRDVPKNQSTHYLYGSVRNLTLAEGKYAAFFYVDHKNRTNTTDPDFYNNRLDDFDTVRNGFHEGYYQEGRGIFFTISKYGKEMDITSTKENCNKLESYPLGIDSYLDYPRFFQHFGEYSSCPSFAVPSPTGRPCDGMLTPEKAKSINDTLNSIECIQRKPLISCPKSVAAQARTSAAAYAVMLAALSIYFW